MSNVLGALRQPVQLCFTRLLAITVASIGLLSAGLYVGATHLGATLRLAGATTDPTPVPLHIGKHRLDVPANVIRFSEQRTPHPQGEVDLYLRWPNLTGFAEAVQDDFHDPDARNILFLRLSATDTKPADQETPGQPSATQIAGLSRSSRTGLPGLASEEAVYRAPFGRTPTYEANCLDGKDVVMAADCIREVQIAPGLQLRYRFSQALMPQWDRMDRSVLDYIETHRRP